MAGSLRGSRLNQARPGTDVGIDPDGEWRRLGLLLRELRIGAGMRRKDLADEINRRIPGSRWTEDTITMAQSGRRHLNLREMHAVAQIFSASWDELLEVAVGDEEIPRSQVLSEETVLAIRVRHAAGVTGASLAAEYGLNAGTVSRIVNGFTWKHVGGPIAGQTAEPNGS